MAVAVLQLRLELDVLLRVMRVLQREALDVAEQRVHDLPGRQEGHVYQQQAAHQDVQPTGLDLYLWIPNGRGKR